MKSGEVFEQWFALQISAKKKLRSVVNETIFGVLPSNDVTDSADYSIYFPS